MKIATFNANSIRAREPVILDWLKKHSPDVLCIQETKVVDELFPVELYRDAGYHVAFRGQKSYNGVAILSVIAPTSVLYGFDDGGPVDDTRLISAKIGPIRVVNTYVPQGREIDHEMYEYKQEWFRRLHTYFDGHFSTRMRLVWVGDMNVAPTEADVHNPEKQAKHVCFHQAVKESFADTVAWGFEDVFRKFHPESGQFTFFDYRMPTSLKENRGWRIDHILATPSLARRATDSYVDLKPRAAERPSDHTFLVAEFDV
jgi:exodeoxyribonuclease-3